MENQEELYSILADSEGYILIFLNKNGKLESRLKGNYQEVFRKLWDSPHTSNPLKG